MLAILLLFLVLGGVPVLAFGRITSGSMTAVLHQYCQGWATEVFFNYGEFNMTGGGATMFGKGTNYGFADGHAKFFVKSQTLTAQGGQAGQVKPANWPNDPVNWPWPAGMWDKRQ
jgi:prepilin-type processing-associated H-X9-DG protein